MTKKSAHTASAKPSTQKPQETIVPELVDFEELTYDEQRDRLHLELTSCTKLQKHTKPDLKGLKPY